MLWLTSREYQSFATLKLFFGISILSCLLRNRLINFDPDQEIQTQSPASGKRPWDVILAQFELSMVTKRASGRDRLARSCFVSLSLSSQARIFLPCVLLFLHYLSTTHFHFCNLILQSLLSSPLSKLAYIHKVVFGIFMLK